jgi:hypothetical protein
VPNYIVRAELFDAADPAAEDQAYEQLYDAMQARGFVDQVQSDDGTAFELPTATFVIQNTDMTTTAAHDAAAAAAQQTGLPYGIIVAEFEETQFSGLQPIQP